MTTTQLESIESMIAGLNPNQRLLATTLQGAVLGLAGAGSGKCITGESLIYTNKGILPIKDIPNHFQVNEDNICSAQILSHDTKGIRYVKNTSHWFNMGLSKTIRITTKSGYQIEGTYEHPLLTLSDDGNLEFKKIKDFTGEEFIVLSKNNDLWSNAEKVNSEIAYLMGLLIADGRLKVVNGNAVYFSNSDPIIIYEYKRILEEQFNITDVTSYTHENSSTIDHYFSNKVVRNYLIERGIKPVNSDKKEIPWSILQSSKRIVISFLQGLFDLESNTTNRNIEITFASEKLIRQLQIVLLNFGIRSSVSEKPVQGYEQMYYRLHISGIALRIFKDEIGYRNNYVASERLALVTMRQENTNMEVYPHQGDRFKRIRNSYFRNQSFWNGKESKLSDIGSIKDYFSGKRNPSAAKIKQIIGFAPNNDKDVKYLKCITDNMLFEKVDKIEYGEAFVYDFTVPETHSFVANGIVNHNTKSLQVRVANLIHHGVKGENIFVATFTNKAAREMRERIEKAVGEEKSKDIWMGTFHSLCVRMLRKHAHLLGYDSKFSIYDSDDQFKMIQRIYQNKGIEKDYKEGFAMWYIDQAKNNLWDPDYCLYHVAETPAYQVMAGVYQQYERMMKEANAMDFGSLIMNVVVLLRDFEEARDYWQQKFHYVHSDEFQDVNYAQVSLLALLAWPHNNICVIG